MRFGVVILPELRWPVAQQQWRRAEELGFDHAWTYDHLAWRALRDAPWFGALPVLTAAAATTQRIRLGTLVASINFRHPVPLARELTAIDDISAGRFIFGVGAGGTGWDATILGQPEWSSRERADRFVEFVTLLDRLLREPATSFTGRYYSANEARSYPGCVQQPRIPFAIAATGRRGMRLAATYADTWVTVGDRSADHPLEARSGAQVVRDQMALLDEVCAMVGRDPRSLHRLVLAGVSLDSGLESETRFRDTAGAYAAIGVTDLVVPWPRPTPPYAADLKTFERIFAR